jgi:hypothetical protein
MSKENFYQNRSVSDILDNLKKQNKDQEARQAQERQRQIEESRRFMKELGVSSIFEELRDSQKLAYFRHHTYTRKEFPLGFIRMRHFTKKVDPAIIEYGCHSTKISLLFNAKKNYTSDEYGVDTVFNNPDSIYVEKRNEGIFVGGTKYENYRDEKISEFKVDRKDQLEDLIAKAIYMVSPYVETSNPPEKVEWFRL